MDQNKNKKSNGYVCRHNDGRAACKNCLKDIREYKKAISSLSKKQRYIVTFGNVGTDPGQSKCILTLQKKIQKEIRKKMTGRVENEIFFPLSLAPETRINEKGEEELALKEVGGKMVLNFINEIITAPVSWPKEKNADVSKKNFHIGMGCTIRKIH